MLDKIWGEPLRWDRLAGAVVCFRKRCPTHREKQGRDEWGTRQRIAFGRGLVTVHWASGAMGLVGVLTKNMFSAFQFRIALLLGACGWLAGFCVVPWVGLGFAAVRVPAAITLLAMAMIYRAIGRSSGISTWFMLLSPAAALLMVYALLRSMATTLRQGGIVWRGTFYGLEELRQNAARLW